MSWRDEERNLLQAARELEPDAERSKARLLARLSTASAVSLAAASVKAAIAVEAGMVLHGAGAAGLGVVAKATVIGSALGAAAALSANGLDPVEPAAGVTSQMTPSRRVETDTRPLEAGEAQRPEVKPMGAEQPERTMPKTILEKAREIDPQGDVPPPPELGVEPEHEAAPGIDDVDEPETQRRVLEALDAARAAVAARHPRAARAALDDYDAHRRDGRLDPEAALLRLRTLQISGHCRQAAALAEQWLAQQPQTTYASALRALVQECRR